MNRRLERLLNPNRIVGVYVASGSAYIVLADFAVSFFWANPDPEWVVDTLKDLLFVGLSAVLLHWMIRLLVARYEAAEAAMRLSEERWNFALQGAGHGVWDWDVETQKCYYSPRWKEILGYAVDEIGNTHEEWSSRIHPDDADHVLEQMRQHLNGTARDYTCEHRVRTKDGSYKWVASRGRVVRRDAVGRALRVIGTQRDITSRRAAEARTREALEFTQTIIRTAPVGILTYEASGEAVSANPAALAFVGGDLPAVLAQNFRQLDSWKRAGLLDLADRALHKSEIVTYRGRYMTTFGRENWGELTFAPFTFDGEQRLLVITHDTTEQHKAIEQLELLHAALNAAPTGWMVTDAKGMIEWVNPGFTRLTGYPLTEVIGQNPNILKSGQHPPAFYADLWQTVTSGRTWEGELCNRRKDRTTYYERMTIAPVRDSGGVIAHFVAMMEDITGQHELEQQLNRSQRLESIGLLASGIAHDLNNMLAPILLSVGLIGSRHQDRETRELLDMMQTAAQRGAGVVQQVLTFARGVEGARTELDVSPLLKELAQLARETFPREIRVAVEVPKLPLLVEGDVTQLHQVLLNLAVNARDAMHDGGVLRLKAESVALDATAARLAPAGKAGDYVKLSVADTGTGIPSEIVDHIFEPFFTTKPRGKGTGLGLSTVFGIVRSHGGFVTVESTLGQGTVFSVLLPRRSAPPTPETKSVAATPAVNGAGRCVLIVDDEASIRLATAEVLKRHGYTVAKAEDGFEALRRLRENPEGFALALVDLMMPGMSGYKLIPELRRLAPRLPVVVVSGMTGDGQAGENRSVLLAAGVRTILDKPFNEAALLEALDVELSVPEYPG